MQRAGTQPVSLYSDLSFTNEELVPLLLPNSKDFYLQIKIKRKNLSLTTFEAT